MRTKTRENPQTPTQPPKVTPIREPEELPDQLDQPDQPEDEPSTDGPNLDDILGTIGDGVTTKTHLDSLAPRIDSEERTGKPAFGTQPTNIEGIEDSKLLDKETNRWPSPPNKNMTWATFQAWYRTLTNYHQQHFCAYLYRGTPVILRPKGERYIDKFFGSLELGPDPNLTMDYIVATHGGGRYKLTINNTSYTRTKTKRADGTTESYGDANEVCSVNFNIEHSIAMPKLNIEELDVKNKENRGYIDYLIREGKLDSTTLKPVTPTVPQSETAAVIREVIDLFKSTGMVGGGGGQQPRSIDKDYLTAMTNAQTKMFELIQSQKGNKSELEIMTLLLPMLDKIVNKPVDTGLNQLVATMMERNDKLFMLLMEKTNQPPPPPPPPVDPFAQLNKLLDLRKKLADDQPTTGGGGGDEEEDNPGKKKLKGWDNFLENVLPQLLPPIMAMGAAWLSGRVNPQQQQQQVPQQQQPIAQPQNVLLPASQQPQQQPQNQPLPFDTTGVNPNMPPTQLPNIPGMPNVPQPLNPIEQKVLELVNGQGQMLINQVYSGGHGGEFAGMLVAMTGGIANGFQQIAALGADRLIELFQMVPAFWVQLIPKEKELRVFVEQFVGYPQSLEDEGDGDEEGIVKE